MQRCLAWTLLLGLSACKTNKAMDAATACDGMSCPVGTSQEEARSVSSTERDVSDGLGPAGDESGGTGFALMGEGACSFACVADAPCPTGTWPVITADCFTCALLDEDGQVIESECEFEGATGTPDTGDEGADEPLDPPTTPTWEQLALGEVHSCGRFSDGTVACWGEGMAPSATADLLVAGPEGTCALSEGTVTCSVAGGGGTLLSEMPSVADAVALGTDTACAVSEDGALDCWGAVSVALPGPVDGAIAGEGYACALSSSGAPTCFGDDSLATVREAPAASFAEVSAGPTHACGRSSTGTLTCWGEDYEGATTVPDGTWSAVAVGDAFTCAIGADHEVVCWGRGGNGQTSPPSDLGPVVAIGVGVAHACATTWDARLVCWGRDEAGQATPAF